MTDREDSVQTCGPDSGYLLTTAGNPVPGIWRRSSQCESQQFHRLTGRIRLAP